MVQVLNQSNKQNAFLEQIDEHFDAPSAPVDNYVKDSSLSGLPAKQGLYDPEYEKDACGVGTTF